MCDIIKRDRKHTLAFSMSRTYTLTKYCRIFVGHFPPCLLFCVAKFQRCYLLCYVAAVHVVGSKYSEHKAALFSFHSRNPFLLPWQLISLP